VRSPVLVQLSPSGLPDATIAGSLATLHPDIQGKWGRSHEVFFFGGGDIYVYI
jgi:hypothetical protein